MSVRHREERSLRISWLFEENVGRSGSENQNVYRQLNGSVVDLAAKPMVIQSRFWWHRRGLKKGTPSSGNLMSLNRPQLNPETQFHALLRDPRVTLSVRISSSPSILAIISAEIRLIATLLIVERHSASHHLTARGNPWTVNLKAKGRDGSNCI
ncbi:hypothetical protein ASPBRDRAFT_26379 [Aspergillus brasiliensis CBS 101740]|uniref:Uncharacterized protein n=1 Tax=Aspergillus brasiliensis (strain CBS 101740 / IMI 381727 / IBT 21946) TaxID=767769 RepID=A0A1L9UW01_ASPBC|nr:hypothetical protein ASPBRDRAFT_26379 [Aspergillus brasiliensis CBS 101740]